MLRRIHSLTKALHPVTGIWILTLSYQIQQFMEKSPWKFLIKCIKVEYSCHSTSQFWGVNSNHKMPVFSKVKILLLRNRNKGIIFLSGAYKILNFPK